MEKKLRKRILTLLLSLTLVVTSAAPALASSIEVPEYTDNAYVALNNNEPTFSDTDKTRTDAFENYSELDSLGRCGVAYANVCKETMPTEPRGDISSIHPTGWHADMGWERCHLIGFQLSGENANARNLITGTHYFNVSGMLPFENMVADYVKETNNHVLYRVTPVFMESNLVASGVQMEAWSVEDSGDGICFNVFCFNVEPGATIDYVEGFIYRDVEELELLSGTFSKSYDLSAIKKSSKTFKVNAETNGETSLKYKKTSGNKKIGVTSDGKVTVKKGLKAGTYKVSLKITSVANAVYPTTTFKKTLTVRITKPQKKNSGKVYWTPGGSVYHKSRNCPTLKRSKTVYSGSIAKSGKPRACKVCS